MITAKARDAYPDLAQAHDAHIAAEKHLAETMASTFPPGSAVRVTHHAGQYVGHIANTDLVSVVVCNEATGKVARRYPLLGAGDNQELTICLI